MSLTAQADVLNELLDAMAEAIRPLTHDAVNWVPPMSDEVNSIAMMARHICGSVDSWLSRAVGEAFQRNRDSEFDYRASTAEIQSLIETTRAESARRLRILESTDLEEIITVRRTLPMPHETRVSRAWCIEHALIHAGEHWGQIQLTRQLYVATSQDQNTSL